MIRGKIGHTFGEITTQFIRVATRPTNEWQQLVLALQEII
jgi:hypothetical protein